MASTHDLETGKAFRMGAESVGGGGHSSLLVLKFTGFSYVGFEAEHGIYIFGNPGLIRPQTVLSHSPELTGKPFDFSPFAFSAFKGTCK